jgi:SNF2 family DNA or RNA helicase
MQVIHGTWIPEEANGFIQHGAFYLWVETDAPAMASSRRRVNAHDHLHPRHLTQTALATFLQDTLGVREIAPGTLARTLCTKYLLLPSAAGTPLPSHELLRYVGEETEEAPETALPVACALAPWQVWCYRVPQVIPALHEIHFLALHAAEDFQLGTDLLVWHQFTQTLKGVIAKDAYIPALKYRALMPGSEAPGHETPMGEIYPGWELVSGAYEAAIQAYAALMPAVCAAGANSPTAAGLFAREALLRHCAECLLHEIVTGTPLTAKLEQQLAGSLLWSCVHPSRAVVLASDRALEDYQQWLAWRASLLATHQHTGLTLCFRLEEAPFTAPDAWQLHFLVAARHDPSYQVDLGAYWPLTAAARAAAIRPFGVDFERQVFLALGHAARIYPTIWAGLATDRPVGCQLTLEEAFAFLKESAWVLEDAGYRVIVPAWWTPEGRQRTRIRLKTAARPATGVGAAGVGHLSLATLIAYQYQLAIGGQAVTEEEWRQLVNAKAPLVQFRGQWMELDRERMQHLLQFWQTQRETRPEMPLQDLLKLDAELGDDLEWDHEAAIQEMLARLQDKSTFAPIPDPEGLRGGTLRDYQRRGVAWLRYLERLGLHPCLADDMGLGKTLEVIACLVAEREEANRAAEVGKAEQVLPTLVIAPTSVLGNWRREIERFAPQLGTLVHQGSARHKDMQTFGRSCQAADVVLTSFSLARLDERLLRAVMWRRVVVDEAQNLKNPQAAQTRAILRLEARHRLALTGTPVENRLRDLWSIFNFLNPGYLGKEPQFRRTFEVPIQRDNDRAAAATLKKLVEPFILRRVKTDQRIIADLPDKSEQKMFCTLSHEQASLYEAVVKQVTEQLEVAEGIQRTGLILSTLLRLKQICNHPAQFLQDGSAFTAERSHKLQRLDEMLEEVLAAGESALVFTQFTEIGSALDRHLAQTQHYRTYYLHGGTSAPRRDQLITQFQDAETEPSVFILSLRAGGVGLTLTKATHVFHFDRWWNPAVEDQATDRAFRIGQRRNVFVHKFVALGTLEERVDALIEDKKRLSSLVVGADESWLTHLDNETFKDLIALRRGAVLD